MELRWYVEMWTEYRDGLAIEHKEKPVLQYSDSTYSDSLGTHEIWVNIPTVYSDTPPVD